MTPRIYRSVREAIQMTATSSPRPMKAIAADLDWSPSDLAHRTALGGDSTRPFPADDEHLIGLMRATNDYSILATLADLCGYELTPKRERTAELLVEVQADLVRTQQRMEQLSLDLRGAGKGRAR
jgi:hypothetical protein